MCQSGAPACRVAPKAACSAVGRAPHHATHGRFHDGDIHHAGAALLKCTQEDARPAVEAAVLAGSAPVFTLVRNPCARVLASVFDKAAGVLRNGSRHRARILPDPLRKYGGQVEGDFDRIAAFHRVSTLARATVRFRKPMDPGIHWSSRAGHLSTLVRGSERHAPRWSG
jgi:hypothetical protein